MTGYGRREPTGWEMAMQGMNFLSNSMEAGQRIGENRYQADERDGVNKALEHIAGKLGSTGDISALDGDPILNTRHGTMAMGQFMQQRAGTETSRLQMLKAMEAADNQFYQNTFRPMAFAAQEAFKAGDLQRFAGIAGELSAKSPMPFRLIPEQDGNFNVEFRSDAAGGWTDTGRKLTPQQAMDEIGNIIGGEQTILAGADMQPRPVNHRFLAAAARYKMGTIAGNAQALADPKKWIPLTKGGHTVYAIPQNRHDDYSTGPSYRVLDEKGGTSAMVGSLDELMSQGYVRADVKADIQNKQRIAAGTSVGGDGLGNMPYKVSDSDQAWSQKIATVSDGMGGEAYNPHMAMCLDLFMGKHGLGRNAAYIALNDTIKKMMNSALEANPKADPAQVQQAAYMKLASELSGNGKQVATPSVPEPQVPPSGADNLRNTVRDVAGENGQTTSPTEEEPLTPEERHRRIVDGGVELTRAIPGAIRGGFEWWKNSIKNNAE